MHSRYEDLCALAVSGQLEERDWTTLREHLRSCSSCRSFLGDAAEAMLQVAPQLAAESAAKLTVEPPAGMRDRFIERALTGGFNCVPGPDLAEPSEANEFEPDPIGPRVVVDKEAGHELWRPRWFRLPPLAPVHAVLTLAACLCFAILGYLLALKNRPDPTVSSLATLSPANDSLSGSSRSNDREERLQEETSRLEQKVLDLSGQLTAARADKEEATAHIKELSREASKVAQFNEQFNHKVKELEEAEERITVLSSELESTRARLAQSDAVLVVQQQATQESNSKLATVERELQKRQEVQTARSEISDLISARNLHIVDVHDSEPGGKRQPAFGRVFYVEGRSLVFYAYDLATGHSDKKIEFHVWGETAGVKETTHSLGILHSDDPSQARWVMTFDDQKVLNRINAVYITADRGAPSKGDPQGKKVLYAFLGSANHP